MKTHRTCPSNMDQKQTTKTIPIQKSKASMDKTAIKMTTSRISYKVFIQTINRIDTMLCKINKLFTTNPIVRESLRHS